jgi:hypothetical protein
VVTLGDTLAQRHFSAHPGVAYEGFEMSFNTNFPVAGQSLVLLRILRTNLSVIDSGSFVCPAESIILPPSLKLCHQRL